MEIVRDRYLNKLLERKESSNRNQKMRKIIFIVSFV